MKNSNWKARIPNLMTMINMTLGIHALFFLLIYDTGDYRIISVMLIFAGALVDTCDGSLARKLNAVTAMGKQLDSFADLVTFGLAPTALVYASGLMRTSLAVPVLAWLYLMAGAYRLARYNLGDFNHYFMGLPITAAGMIVTLYSSAFLIWDGLFTAVNPGVITSCLLALLAFLMVSRFKVKRLRIYSSSPTSR